jgi:hypothetical protein
MGAAKNRPLAVFLLEGFFAGAARINPRESLDRSNYLAVVQYRLHDELFMHQ